jgi:hypothetical protein
MAVQVQQRQLRRGKSTTEKTRKNRWKAKIINKKGACVQFECPINLCNSCNEHDVTSLKLNYAQNYDCVCFCPEMILVSVLLKLTKPNFGITENKTTGVEQTT